LPEKERVDYYFRDAEGNKKISSKNHEIAKEGRKDSTSPVP